MAQLNNVMKKQIEITIEQAIEIYKKSDELTNQILLNSFTKEELENKDFVKSWEESFNNEGFLIYGNSLESVTFKNLLTDKSCFKSEKQAKSAFAFAQLSHIVADANGDWEADWSNWNQDKFCIELCRNELCICTYNTIFHFLPMKNAQIRKECLEKHRQLWEEFWMI